MILNFPNGMTIKELKELVKDLPEQDENGDDFGVWITNHNGLTNIVHEFANLNQKENGSDILLS